MSALKEACQLAKASFEYITEIDGTKIFRRHKYELGVLFQRADVVVVTPLRVEISPAISFFIRDISL
jgi:hypothetical protein